MDAGAIYEAAAGAVSFALIAIVGLAMEGFDRYGRGLKRLGLAVAVIVPLFALGWRIAGIPITLGALVAIAVLVAMFTTGLWTRED